MSTVERGGKRDTITKYKPSKRRGVKVKNFGCKKVNSDRENDRRRQQIDREQLKVENGLIV